MADHTQFKHIKVNAACDDVVIYAGTHDSGKASGDAAAKPSADLLEASAAVRPEKHDDYSPTTIQDLRTSKMPAVQKAIIAIAVLAVAAFVIWYLSFR